MSSRTSPVINLRILAAALLLIFAAPLAAQEPVADSEAPEAEAKTVEETASPGMSIPLDGDSLKTFEKSLEMVRAETTTAEFTTLQNALDYLLVYDLGARRNRELLYQRLDGKTPADVLAMVKWRLEGRQPERRERQDS